MNNKYLILDCFVDEPACFGVPPFISPYPRYIYGALTSARIDNKNIFYQTIDSLRQNKYLLKEKFKIVFIIGGAVVPGKYLGQKIGSFSEIKKIVQLNINQQFAAGGLISHVICNYNLANLFTITKDIEYFAFTYALTKPEDNWREYKDLNIWSILGADVVKQHPDFPNIIAEIETYRGCPRTSHCSFCSEAIFDKINFREQDKIIAEIDALINNNILRFRIGRQADILAYKADLKYIKNSFPRPNPNELKILFDELGSRVKNKKIQTLNIDNANPGTIINFPKESEKIINILADSITAGDTMPLGVESFDPKVHKLNNLKVNRKECIQIVKIINKIGGKRIENIPVLLPGVNLIQGLIGETKNTFKENYLALTEIMENGLLLKRINIRKLSPFPGTPISKQLHKKSEILLNRYEYYKGKIRKEIDHYMLSQIYPLGTILKNVRIEDTRFDYSYGRQLISYAITIKIPGKLKLKSIIDIIVIGHRERSLIGLPEPIRLKELSTKALELIPGIGKSLSSHIALKRQSLNTQKLKILLENVDSKIINSIII